MNIENIHIQYICKWPMRRCDERCREEKRTKNHRNTTNNEGIQLRRLAIRLRVYVTAKKCAYSPIEPNEITVVWKIALMNRYWARHGSHTIHCAGGPLLFSSVFGVWLFSRYLFFSLSHLRPIGKFIYAHISTLFLCCFCFCSFFHTSLLPTASTSSFSVPFFPILCPCFFDKVLRHGFTTDRLGCFLYFIKFTN